MPTPKTTCPKCGVEFLQSTADANKGHCRKCRGKFDIEDVEDAIGIGMRLLRGCIFSVVFSAIGFALGSQVWTGIGLLLSGILFPVGFGYGLFCREINFVIRQILKL